MVVGICRILALVLLIAASTADLGATTIYQFFSRGPQQPSQDPFDPQRVELTRLNKDILWSDPFPGSDWISFNLTSIAPNTVFIPTPNGVVARYTMTFTLPEAPTSATISVMADDNATLRANNSLAIAAAPSIGNTYATCSDFPIGCLPNTRVTIDLAPYLVAGVNTLVFDVAQLRGASFGLNFAGSVILPGNHNVQLIVQSENLTPQVVPEPGTVELALCGALFLAIWGVLRRKRS